MSAAVILQDLTWRIIHVPILGNVRPRYQRCTMYWFLLLKNRSSKNVNLCPEKCQIRDLLYDRRDSNLAKSFAKTHIR